MGCMQITWLSDSLQSICSPCSNSLISSSSRKICHVDPFWSIASGMSAWLQASGQSIASCTVGSRGKPSLLSGWTPAWPPLSDWMTNSMLEEDVTNGKERTNTAVLILFIKRKRLQSMIMFAITAAIAAAVARVPACTTSDLCHHGRQKL